MGRDLLITEKVQLRPHSCTRTTQFRSVTQEPPEPGLFGPDAERPSWLNTEGLKRGPVERFNGYLSPTAKRALRNRSDAFLSCLELNTSLRYTGPGSIYPTFVTLTLPSNQWDSDNTIKRYIFTPFLQWLTYEPKRLDRRKKEYRDLTDAEFAKLSKDQPGDFAGLGVKCYLWRAEPQQEGGSQNIHFHLIIDRWVDADLLRRKWNECCEALGYVSRYRAARQADYWMGFRIIQTDLKRDTETFGRLIRSVLRNRRMPKKIHPVFVPWLQRALKRGQRSITDLELAELCGKVQEHRYRKGTETDWSDPNSTDIHAIQNIQSLSAYISKYITKEGYTVEKDELTINGETVIREVGVTYHVRALKGRIWGCSDNLRQIEVPGEYDGNGNPFTLPVAPPTFTVSQRLRADFVNIRDLNKWFTVYIGGYAQPVRGSYVDVDLTSYLDAAEKQVPPEDVERLKKLIPTDYVKVVPLPRKTDVLETANHRKPPTAQPPNQRKKGKRPPLYKQHEYLEEVCPKVLIRFLDYYRMLFAHLYHRPPYENTPCSTRAA